MCARTKARQYVCTHDVLVHVCLHGHVYSSTQVQIQPITRTILRVTLNIKAQFEWSDRVSGTVEPFWIWVEDNENERIYHTEYFLLHKKQLRETHVLAFTVPPPPLPSSYP